MDIYSIFDFWQKCSSNFVNTEYSFLNSLTPVFNKLRKEKEDFDKNNFNIFSFISKVYSKNENVYEKENPNSEILKLLLDPNTQEIGDAKVLESFFEFIGLENHKKLFPNLCDVKIEREKHRIDIYIHNDENAVIIESKLYGARHQDFQLARYYIKATKEDGYNVQKIIYLTLNPIPPLNLKDLYEPSENKKGKKEEQEEYYSVVEKIEPLIKYISARARENEMSLSYFFDECSKKVENELLRMILKQYSKLLIRLAGEEVMTSAEKKFFQKIYESQDSINNALDFIDLWKKKDEALWEICVDIFKEKHKDWIYEEEIFYKEVNGYWLYLYYNEIGFWSEHFEENEIKKLREVLENLDIGDLARKGEIQNEEKWVYMDFVYEDEPIKPYFNSILKSLENLENDVSNLKNEKP